MSLVTPLLSGVDRLMIGWINGVSFITSTGTTGAEDAQGTPTQSHISPSIPVYEEKKAVGHAFGGYPPDPTKPGSNLTTPHSDIRTLLVASGVWDGESCKPSTRSKNLCRPRESTLSGGGVRRLQRPPSCLITCGCATTAPLTPLISHL